MLAPIRFSGDALRRLRCQRHQSVTALAARIGRTEDAVRGYESGRFAPTAQALGAIASALDCSVADLFAPKVGR
jgi:transcriptional regulator with XRE-family HTH domain